MVKKKSYNPFKMWGSYVGVLIIIFFILLLVPLFFIRTNSEYDRGDVDTSWSLCEKNGYRESFDILTGKGKWANDNSVFIVDKFKGYGLYEQRLCYRRAAVKLSENNFYTTCSSIDDCQATFCGLEQCCIERIGCKRLPDISELNFVKPKRIIVNTSVFDIYYSIFIILGFLIGYGTHSFFRRIRK